MNHIFSTIRFFTRLFLLLVLTIFGLLLIAMALVLYPKWADRLIQFWSRLFCFIVGVSITLENETANAIDTTFPTSLWVANHQTWLDILILQAYAPVKFVSKAEIRQWPVIGWMAGRAGTVFIERGNKASSEQTVSTLSDYLHAGRHVAVFPEGRTFPDGKVHRFHGRLFQAAIDRNIPIQPAAIRFEQNGLQSAELAYQDDESLIANLFRILPLSRTRCKLVLLQPLSCRNPARQALANQAQEAIAVKVEDSKSPPEFPPELPHYAPSFWIKNPNIQTILASTALRQLTIKRNNPMLAASRPLIIETDLVKLACQYAPNPQSNGRLVVLIHGWEGGADSTYILSTARQLWQAGLSVLRVNLRDHGETHHLNRDLFHSCRLTETTEAIAAIQDQFSPSHLSLVGFSLGGNFALRIGLKSAWHPLKINQIIAVCPLISPKNGLRSIESGLAAFNHYFVSKWSRSLRIKQKLFPDAFDIDQDLKNPGLISLTETLIPRFSNYPDMEHYFDGYNIGGDRLSTLQIPTQIITAMDDPIIPFQDFLNLQLHDNTTLVATQHGGHCGFIENLSLQAWTDRIIARLIG